MKKPNILTVGIASLLTLPTALTAADRDWIGAPGTTNWNDTANWSGGNVPTTGTGDNIYIHTTGSITGVAIDANQLILDAKSISVRKQAAAHAVEADRRKVPGTPWFFIKIGTDPPKLVRPTAYSGEAFATLLDEALGR